MAKRVNKRISTDKANTTCPGKGAKLDGSNKDTKTVQKKPRRGYMYKVKQVREAVKRGRKPVSSSIVRAVARSQAKGVLGQKARVSSKALDELDIFVARRANEVVEYSRELMITFNDWTIQPHHVRPGRYTHVYIVTLHDPSQIAIASRMRTRNAMDWAVPSFERGGEDTSSDAVV